MFIYEIIVDGISKDMVAASPIFSKSGQLLVTEGARLNENIKKQLKRMGIEKVQVRFYSDFENDETHLGAPNLQGKYEGNGQETATFSKINKDDDNFRYKYKADKYDINKIVRDEILMLVRLSLSKHSNTRAIGNKSYSMIDLIFTQIANTSKFMNCILDVKSIDQFTFKHSVDVAVLSLLVSISLGLRRDDMYIIALGALLHDIGKRSVERDVLFSDKQLTVEQMLKMQKHPEYGYESLLKFKEIPKQAAIVALQHHERIDGSGYPIGLSKDQISLHSQIVGIADIYEAMTSERNNRKSYAPTEVIEYLMAAGNIFNETIINNFINIVSVYKIGSMVEINSGEIGIVIKSSSCSRRPVIKIVYDSNKERVSTPTIIDLSLQEFTTVHIVRSYE